MFAGATADNEDLHGNLAYGPLPPPPPGQVTPGGHSGHSFEWPAGPGSGR
ncbi:hypothetical protein SCATT_33310 [Streptantibioticus cattleyicolor NRRL 8057 = DSM 46488]|uniref:Uncharacterized protein n=1 Tax=Streptantibioticus cattleyicolor (strain ATCC 35852 / DSM 46488 / JCM 4925 / NBRC 14057 / NRRL 8057) TaxID=1003195 RepID=G8WQU2_STREN|nr:hypothetical protein SCATT_33310 [Streptantibioticus cattleyicolor NRRL 8057 = DSM 46488]